MPDKRQIRRRIRHQRRDLSSTQQRNAELGIARSARKLHQLWFCDRIMAYTAFDGEASPNALLNTLPNKQLFLPRITNFRTYRMQIYQAHKSSRTNRYGIIEPDISHPSLHANAMDAILMPLVAFDRQGNRIGMGAGYYDRALQALRHQTSTRPLLVGVAHSFQEVEFIEPQPWDIRLDAILTDLEFISTSTHL